MISSQFLQRMSLRRDTVERVERYPFRFSTRRSHSVLHEHLRIGKGFKRPRTGFFLRAESFFNVATEIEQLDAEPGLGAPVIRPRTW